MQRYIVLAVLICLHLPSDALSVDSAMVYVEGGCFTMGSANKDSMPEPDEYPHKVCLKDFYIDRHEVTQREFQQMMRKNPSRTVSCPQCPVDSVSWVEADKYCKLKGKRLPTEAQWEYAARGRGRETVYSGTSTKPEDYGWYNENSGGGSHPVGSKQPNELGIYDMTGNVWEWCSDWYDEDYYRVSPEKDPRGPEKGEYKVMRGGSWNYYKSNAIVTNRFASPADGGYPDNSGFRCVK